MISSTGTISVETENKKVAFEPGERLCGTLYWSSDRPKTEIELRLGWYIKNEPQRDIICHCSERYTLTDHTGTRAFEIILPQGPLSYSGELFSLEWMLEARTRDRKLVFQLSLTIGKAKS